MPSWGKQVCSADTCRSVYKENRFSFLPHTKRNMFYGQCHLVLPFVVFSCLSDSIAAPVPSELTGNQKRLLSRSSGQYVHIGENGALNGGGSYSSAAVFTVTFRDTYYEFESDSNANLYLMIQAINVTIESDELQNNSLSSDTKSISTTVEEMGVSVGRVSAERSYWKWTIKTFDDDTRIQVINIQRTDCYLAFNEDSSLAGPCNMSDDDPRTFFDLLRI